MHLFHKWSRWKEITVAVWRSRNPNNQWEELGQERECLKCGKKELRRLS